MNEENYGTKVKGWGDLMEPDEIIEAIGHLDRRSLKNGVIPLGLVEQKIRSLESLGRYTQDEVMSQIQRIRTMAKK